MPNQRTVALCCKFCKETFVHPASYVTGQERAGHRVRYCSRSCAWKGRAQAGQIVSTCRWCQSKITNWKSQIGNMKTERKYCSKSCMDEYRRSIRPVVKCIKCGTEVAVPPSAHRRRKYCSAQCAEVAKTELSRNCLECSKEFRYVPSTAATARYCSMSCKNVHEGRERRKGFDYEEGLLRCSRWAWRDLRLQIIARDGGRCTRCGTTEKLIVHHVVAWKISRDDSPSNLITLCLSCHMIVEPRSFPPRASGNLPWGGVPSQA